MKTPLKRVSLYACILCTLCACSEQEYTLEEQQYDELVSTFYELKNEEKNAEWLQEELPPFAETEELLRHYDKNHDATYATPSRKLTMLHLACMFKKTELVKQLLNDGADPNAFTLDEDGQKADTPLRFAISPGFLEEDTDERNLQLVEELIKAGANSTGIISHNENLLSTAAVVCESEELAKKLLPYAPPATLDDLMRIMERGWANVLQEILNRQEILPNEAQALLAITAYPINHKSAEVNCLLADLMLQRGADINKTSGFTNETLLRSAAFQLAMFEDKALRDDWLNFIAFLIKKGANPASEQDLLHHGTYAYDHLAGLEGVPEALAARGCVISAPAMEIRTGSQLCNDIIRAQMRRIPKDEILKHFDTIASVFAPTEELNRDEMCSIAIVEAAKLLSKADAARTAEYINNSPLWQKKISFDHESHTEPSAADLIYALNELSVISVEPQKLLQVAEEAIELKDFELATTAVQILGRCQNAEEHIEKLIASPHIAIRAGAWNARLHLAGLPTTAVGDVKHWLQANNREANTHVLQTVLLATSLDEIWENKMSAERKQQFYAALHAVGAPNEAILVYGEFADNMNNPEKLDELSALGDNWKYELEIATAKYIFAHAKDILSPAPQKED